MHGFSDMRSSLVIRIQTIETPKKAIARIRTLQENTNQSLAEDTF